MTHEDDQKNPDRGASPTFTTSRLAWFGVLCSILVLTFVATTLNGETRVVLIGVLLAIIGFLFGWAVETRIEVGESSVVFKRIEDVSQSADALRRAYAVDIPEDSEAQFSENVPIESEDAPGVTTGRESSGSPARGDGSETDPAATAEPPTGRPLGPGWSAVAADWWSSRLPPNLTGPNNPAEFVTFWEDTYKRIVQYHQDASNQLRSSYRFAQASAIIGFLIVGALGGVAATASTTAQSATAAAVGVVGAGLAAFIGRTFNATYTKTLLRSTAFFHEPVVIARLLAAERLLSEYGDDGKEERAKALTIMINAAVNFETGAVPDVSVPSDTP